MAVTKSEAIQALTAAALALPGMVPEAQAGQLANLPQVDLQYGHYQESGNRISVDVYQGSSVLPVSKSLQIEAGWVVDTFSGATPVLTVPQEVAGATTGASGINRIYNNQKVAPNERVVQVMTGASTRETRYGVDIGFKYLLDQVTLHASGNRSDEPDYVSHGYHIGADWDFNRKLTSLSFGFGQSFDRVAPTTRPLREEKSDYHFQLGISQIVNKESLLRASVAYTHSDGYLSNPYKKVFIQDLDHRSNLQSGGFDQVYYENRPGEREQGSISLGYVQYISLADSALHLDYRYFIDSWGIDSHTFEASYHQPLDKEWMLVPRIRYYSQTGADFYREYYEAPRSDGHYSSDFRLAGFGALSGGFHLSREWQKASQLAESIKLEAGFEYTTHQAGLQLGGQTTSDVTDFSFMLFTAAISMRF